MVLPIRQEFGQLIGEPPGVEIAAALAQIVAQMRHPIGLLALGGRETERPEGATLLRAIEGPRIQGSAMSPRQE